MTLVIKILNAFFFCVCVYGQTEFTSEPITEFIGDSVSEEAANLAPIYNGHPMQGHVSDSEATPDNYNGEFIPEQATDFEQTPTSYNGEVVPEQVTDFEQTPTSYNGEVVPEQVTDFEQTPTSYNGEVVPEQVTDFEQTTTSYNGEVVPEQVTDFEQTPTSYNGEVVPEQVTYFEQPSTSYNEEIVPEQVTDFEQPSTSYNGEVVPEQVTDFEQTPTSYNGEVVPEQVTDFEQTPTSYNGEVVPEQATEFEKTPTNYNEGIVPDQIPYDEQLPNAYSSSSVPEEATNLDHTTIDHNGESEPGEFIYFDQSQSDYYGESVPDQATDSQIPPSNYNGDPAPGQVTDFEQVPSGYSGESAPGQVTAFDQIPNGYNGLGLKPGFPVVRPPGFALPPGLQSLPRPIAPVPALPVPLPAVPVPLPAVPAIPPIVSSILQPTISRLPAGFVCVPAGTCPAPPTTNGIDIRIVTPGDCPTGQVPCNAAGSTQCGVRFVSNVNIADGPTTAGSYPWQIYLVNQTGFAGSGVLLDRYHVLTAAHKVYMNGGTPNLIGVYVGVYNPAQLGMRYNVARVFVHPNFNPSNLFNDLALLRLSTPVAPLPQQNVNTVCMPTQGQTFVGQTCWVSGWGQTAFNANNAPTIQRQVQVPIVAYGTCYASMSNITLLGANVNTYLDPVGELCAGGQGLRDACTQDGGSPLVCNVGGRFTVAGLVIWGKGCGRQGVYGVYVNIANYVTWITSSIAMLNG